MTVRRQTFLLIMLWGLVMAASLLAFALSSGPLRNVAFYTWQVVAAVIAVVVWRVGRRAPGRAVRRAATVPISVAAGWIAAVAIGVALSAF